MHKDSHEIPNSVPRSSGWLNFLRARIGQGWLFAAGIITAFLGILLHSVLFPPPTPMSADQIDESIMEAMASATPPSAYSAQVYQAILPSLVLIQTQRENPEEQGKVGVGSGVVINANGEILTALHVVADAAEVEVIFADGTQANAIISVAEPENDIAVLQPSQPPEIIVPAILGNSNAMRIGDETFAVGNPLGLTGSLSAGVIWLMRRCKSVR